MESNNLYKMESHNIFFHDAFSDLKSTTDTEVCIFESYKQRMKIIKEYVEKETGHCVHKGLKAIRTLTIHVLPDTEMSQLQNLSIVIEKKYKVKCIQITLNKRYNVAHLMFDWLNRSTCLSTYLNKSDFSYLSVLIIRKLGLPKTQKSKFFFRKFFQQEYDNDNTYFQSLQHQLRESNLDEDTKDKISESLEYLQYVCMGIVK